MISDVLDEAGSEIDRYLEHFPHTYTGVTRQWIRSLRLQMQTVQALLDDPTFDTHDDGVPEPQSLKA